MTFALPALLLSQWLPGRTAQIRKQKRRPSSSPDGLSPERRRLLAMRAAFSPRRHLLRYTEDPIGDLEDGRYDALVAVRPGEMQGSNPAELLLQAIGIAKQIANAIAAPHISGCTVFQAPWKARMNT